MSGEVGRPFYRTLLGRVLFGWMGLTLLVVLTFAAWLPILPFAALGPALLAIYLVAPAGLLIWSVWAAIRRPRTAWPGPLLLVAFCGSFVLSAQKLAVVGAYVGLIAHRSAYDAIVRDTKAGQLAVQSGARRWVERRRGSVRYVASLPEFIAFPLDHDPYGGWIGILYDDHDCPPNPAPPAEQVGPGGIPVLKNAGRLDQRFHLADHYCLSVFNGM